MNKLQKMTQSAPLQYGLLVVYAILYSVVCEIFVFQNNFAPAGIMGLATMIQYVFHFNVGSFSLIINIPMLVATYFLLDRKYALRTLTFVLVSSLTFLVLDKTQWLAEFVYTAEDTGGRILAAIAAGLFNGVLYSLAVRAGGCTGGTDVIAAFIHKSRPEFNMVWIIFALNAAVAGLSFFVYDMTYQPVMLCVVYVFVNSRIGDTIFKGARGAAKFEIVTSHAEEIAAELLQKLNHGCTVVPAKGMYTHTDRSMLICVVNRRQIVDFERIIRKYDNTFAYISTVNGIFGSFNRSRKK